jgi:hypothetical protein
MEEGELLNVSGELSPDAFDEFPFRRLSPDAFDESTERPFPACESYGRQMFQKSYDGRPMKMDWYQVGWAVNDFYFNPFLVLFTPWDFEGPLCHHHEALLALVRNAPGLVSVECIPSDRSPVIEVNGQQDSIAYVLNCILGTGRTRFGSAFSADIIQSEAWYYWRDQFPSGQVVSVIVSLTDDCRLDLASRAGMVRVISPLELIASEVAGGTGQRRCTQCVELADSKHHILAQLFITREYQLPATASNPVV